MVTLSIVRSLTQLIQRGLKNPTFRGHSSLVITKNATFDSIHTMILRVARMDSN